jgi:hypothetical protein
MVRPSVSAQPANPPSTKRKTHQVDLASIPTVPWALLNEFEAAAVLGLSAKTLRRLRMENRPPRYRKLNGVTIRYQVSDLHSYLAAQPTGGGPVTEASGGKTPKTHRSHT